MLTLKEGEWIEDCHPPWWNPPSGSVEQNNECELCRRVPYRILSVRSAEQERYLPVCFSHLKDACRSCIAHGRYYLCLLGQR